MARAQMSTMVASPHAIVSTCVLQIQATTVSKHAQAVSEMNSALSRADGSVLTVMLLSCDLPLRHYLRIRELTAVSRLCSPRPPPIPTLSSLTPTASFLRAQTGSNWNGKDIHGSCSAQPDAALCTQRQSTEGSCCFVRVVPFALCLCAQMEGVDKPPELKGMVPRAFDQIFEHIAASSSAQFLVRASFLEIYNV